jgi:hypothetical protein
MERATLGEYAFYIDPESASWSFAVNTKEHENVGGKVVQVLGIKQSDITVVGSFSSPKKRIMEDGSTRIVGGLVEQERFLQSMISQSKSYTEEPDSAPLRFRVPSMGWDFGVRIKEYAGIGHRRSVRVSPATIVNPQWKLTLHVDADTRELRRIGADEFIKRLTKGMGWKATEYQGPLTPEESFEYLRDKMLPGESLEDFFTRIYAEVQGIFTNRTSSDTGAFDGGNLQNPGAVPGTANEGANTTIMGVSLTPFSRIKEKWLSIGKPERIPALGNMTIDQLLDLYNQESRLEGVRGDWAFAQACQESGYFTSPDVPPPRCVFAGIGKTDSRDLGYSFQTPELGVRAHIVFMKRVANGNNVRLRSSIQAWADGTFSSGGGRLTWGLSPVTTWGGLTGSYASDAQYFQTLSSVYRLLGGDPGG